MVPNRATKTRTRPNGSSISFRTIASTGLRSGSPLRRNIRSISMSSRSKNKIYNQWCLRRHQTRQVISLRHFLHSSYTLPSGIWSMAGARLLIYYGRSCSLYLDLARTTVEDISSYTLICCSHFSMVSPSGWPNTPSKASQVSSFRFSISQPYSRTSSN